MDIFQFKDGTIYHDRDWNEMQRKIYREIKDRATLLDYKLDILSTPYDYLLYDSFVDEDQINLINTTAYYNVNKLVYEGSDNPTVIETNTQSIDIATDTCYLNIDAEGQEDLLTCSISIDDGLSWQSITPFQDIILPSPSMGFKIKIEIPADPSIVINSFALYLNKS